jgi:hypothetical protein
MQAGWAIKPVNGRNPMVDLAGKISLTGGKDDPGAPGEPEEEYDPWPVDESGNVMGVRAGEPTPEPLAPPIDPEKGTTEALAKIFTPEGLRNGPAPRPG